MSGGGAFVGGGGGGLLSVPREIPHTERQFLCPMHFYLSEGNAGWSR